MNQSAFYINDRINCHNVRVANAARIVNFNIYRNDENIIDSNFDFLHVEISIKRALQDIIVTINNQLAKKRKKRSKNTKNRSRTELLFRVEFNALSYAKRNSVSDVLLSRNIKRASERIVARAKRTIKQKIEHSNQNE